MSYTDKLKAFNNTERYQKELDQVTKELSLSDKVLDYGCGTGYAVDKLTKEGFNVVGYDAQRHSETFNYTNATGKWDVVYFMHSIAHVHGIKEVLKALDTRKVVIVTPNKNWLNSNKTPTYIPDSTVIKHYDSREITELLVDSGFKKIRIEAITQGERLFVTARK